MRALFIDNHDSYTFDRFRGWSRWSEAVCARTPPQSTAYAPRFPRGRWPAPRSRGPARHRPPGATAPPVRPAARPRRAPRTSVSSSGRASPRPPDRRSARAGRSSRGPIPTGIRRRERLEARVVLDVAGGTVDTPPGGRGRARPRRAADAVPAGRRNLRNRSGVRCATPFHGRW